MRFKRKLGEILTEKGIINENQVLETLAYQKEHGGRLGGNLVRLGFCNADQVTDAIIDQLSESNLDSLSGYLVDTSTVALIPYDMAKDNQIMPIELDGQILLTASTQPLTPELTTAVLQQTGYHAKTLVLPEPVIRSAIQEYYAPLLQAKKSWVDDDRFRSLLVIVIILLLLLFLVCNFKEQARSYKESSLNTKPQQEMIEELNPMGFEVDDDLDMNTVADMVDDLLSSQEGEILILEGKKFRDHKAVKRVLAWNLDELIRYYNLYLRRKPTLRGNVIFNITIEPEGVVSNVKIMESEIKDQVFVNGAIEIIKQWKFEPIDEGTVIINFPFNFTLVR